MKLNVVTIREEIADLKRKKAQIDKKIRGLETYLGIGEDKDDTVKTNGISARGGVDIKPTVRKIYGDNGNQALKFKDLVDSVAQRHPDMVRILVEKKMEMVKRNILEKTETYGFYRLKAETPQPSGQGVA